MLACPGGEMAEPGCAGAAPPAQPRPSLARICPWGVRLPGRALPKPAKNAPGPALTLLQVIAHRAYILTLLNLLPQASLLNYTGPEGCLS